MSSRWNTLVDSVIIIICWPIWQGTKYSYYITHSGSWLYVILVKNFHRDDQIDFINNINEENVA
jgi:hypothetical protein